METKSSSAVKAMDVCICVILFTKQDLAPILYQVLLMRSSNSSILLSVSYILLMVSFKHDITFILHAVSTRVPHSFILGPVVFLTYSNDLLKLSNILRLSFTQMTSLLQRNVSILLTDQLEQLRCQFSTNDSTAS